ncbi:MAG TPA: class I SAM-dependent methyltransferase, partial [Bacillota bacterium]|nr:class I SAM-dependent methyltransferase [Bacillota bacterium]
MQESLKQETEKLARCWMQHEAAWLRDYLVADVEDPRLNLQSILSRHFLLRAIAGERFQALMEQEYRFAAVMNWLRALARRVGDTEELAAVLHALKQGADNAEGIEIPQFVVRAFASLPAVAGDLTVPNYLESFLTATLVEKGQAKLHEPSLETFQKLWNTALAGESPAPLSVLEPACGSANDFRFLQAYGIARLVDYTGFDLCAKNVENARALFPHFRFETGNVFAIAAPDKAYDFCFAHDLLEHLSPEGMQTAVQELCRVTRRGLCVGFFNMDEIPAHLVQPVEEYHWNKLSMARMKELFA